MMLSDALLDKVESILKKESTYSATNVEEIKYLFERPDINILNPIQVLGIVSLILKGDAKTEQIQNLLSSKEIITKVLEEKGSNSIKEDIEQAFIGLIDKKTKLPKHSKKRPVVRDVRGKFYNVSNLQAVLNERLHDQIKRNMGKGNARAVLNYRSGRFAHSAEVKRITMDKNGALQAFYSYMKYPYQTFEPGYAQGEPESRDPKLLIGKSIREIAKDVVINRLKAISL